MAEAAKWYVVHTYSGYENTVKATIEKTVEARQLQEIIHTVSIPMETVTEITDNGPKTYDRKLFPGYVLVKMVMTDDTWHIIKNVRGVTGFITSGSTKPTPLSDDELYQLGVGSRFGVRNGRGRGLTPPNIRICVSPHYYLEVLSNGTENYWLYQASDPGRESDCIAPCRSGSRPARR